jgi:predicted phage-related endonuclease
MNKIVKPGSKEWHEERRKRICSSDVPKILSLCNERWGTGRDVCLDKWGEKKDVAPTPQMVRGIKLQLPIAWAYQQRMDEDLLPEYFQVHENGWMAATPDAQIVDKRKHLQIKTHIIWLADEYGEDGSDEVPYYDMVQVAHELACTQNDEADLCALFAYEEVFDSLIFMMENGATPALIGDFINTKMDLRIFNIKRDMSLEVDLIEAEREFKEKYIDTHTLPPDFKTMEESGEIRAATTDEFVHIVALKESYLKMLPYKKDFELYKEKLINFIAGAPGIDSSLGKITHKFNKGSVSWKSIANALIERLGMTDEAVEKLKKDHTGAGARKFNYPYKAWKKDA